MRFMSATSAPHVYPYGRPTSPPHVDWPWHVPDVPQRKGVVCRIPGHGLNGCCSNVPSTQSALLAKSNESALLWSACAAASMNES